MPAHTQSTAKTSATRKSAANKTPDATAILKEGHRGIEKLFGQFDKATSRARKDALAREICQWLHLHMQLEEEIFYPASREFLAKDDIVDESMAEHAAAKGVMAEIARFSPLDERLDGTVAALEKLIAGHIKDEETDYFPKVRKTDMDLHAVGARLQARYTELMAALNEAGKGKAAH